MLSGDHAHQITIVTPTRNRADHVRSMLASLSEQTLLPAEIIIVDASDEDGYLKSLSSDFPSLNIITLRSTASVCIQRNVGVRAAHHPWVLLCDDDITLDPDYLATLIQYVRQHPDVGALAGRLMQFETDAGWVDQYPPRTWWGLWRRYIFGISVWGSVDHLQPPPGLGWLHQRMLRRYQQRGNTLTRAGWPLITQWTAPAFQTRIYSLGANLFRRDWLLQSPYDEVLDRSGIGDNYGVALGFPGGQSIHVLQGTRAHHHRASDNRLKRVLSYYRRILALHYFIYHHPAFNWTTRTWYLWSLLGNGLGFLAARQWTMLWANTKAMGLIILQCNPYVLGKRRHRVAVEPMV